MSKINDLTISVTLNGSEVSRDYHVEDITQIDLEQAVLDMVDTLQAEDKHSF